MTAQANLLDRPPADLVPNAAPGRVLPRPETRRRWSPYPAGVAVCATLAGSAVLQSGQGGPVWILWVCVLASMAALSALGRPPTIMPAGRTLLVLGSVFAGFILYQALALPGWRGGIDAQTPAGPVTLNHLSFAPNATALGLLRVLGYLVFFWLVMQLAHSHRRARKLAMFVFALIAGQAVFAVLALTALGDIGFPGRKTAYLGAATGTFINKNALAAYLGFGLVLGLALFGGQRAARHRPQTIAIRAIWLTILVALVLTSSRMGLAASSAGVVTVCLIRHPVALLSRVRAPHLLAGGMAAGLLALFLDPTSGSPLSTRTDLYRQVATMIADRPLTGFGFDSFPLAFQLYHKVAVWPGVLWNNTHSSYLTLWVETGILAGSLPLVAGLLAMRSLWRRARLPAAGQSLAAAGLGALMLGALHSTLDFSLENMANAYVLLTLIALGIGTPETTKGKRP